jgi:hypothetical protein
LCSEFGFSIEPGEVSKPTPYCGALLKSGAAIFDELRQGLSEIAPTTPIYRPISRRWPPRLRVMSSGFGCKISRRSPNRIEARSG